MVKMKRLFLLCAFVSMFATCNFISAQKELGIFNSVSAGVGVDCPEWTDPSVCDKSLALHCSVADHLL